MDITITVSERTGQIIKEKAKENDMVPADFASDLLEDKVKQEFPQREVLDEPHPLLKFAGMFSSGRTDTSSRYKEILMEEVKMPGGFGGGE